MQTKQSDSEFLSNCQLDEHLATDALGIRKAIANLAGVESETIRVEDRFDVELLKFEFWGSLDSITLVYELEKCLGIKITDRMAEKIPNPELKHGLTISDWVQLVLKATSDLKDR